MTLVEYQQVRKAKAAKLALDQVFYCRPRRKRLPIGTCLNDYMNANAFTDKRSACWRCPLGCQNRTRYSEGA